MVQDAGLGAGALLLSYKGFSMCRWVFFFVKELQILPMPKAHYLESKADCQDEFERFEYAGRGLRG